MLQLVTAYMSMLIVRNLLKSTNLMLCLNLLSELKSTTSAGKQFHGATTRSANKCFLYGGM